MHGGVHVPHRYVDQGRSFTAFAYGIAGHKVADALRVCYRDKSEPVDVLPEPVDTRRGLRRPPSPPTRPPAPACCCAPARAAARAAAAARGRGLSAEDTGAALGMTAGAVRVAQHRALAKLRVLAAEEQA